MHIDKYMYIFRKIFILILPFKQIIQKRGCFLMKRKVSLHGPSTLTVSLPSKWAKKYGIKQGDEIEVEEKNNILIINAKKGRSVNKKEINISNLYPLIRRTLVKTYQEGYDEVLINFNEPGLLSQIQGITGELIGFEVIEQRTNHCILKDISGASGENFDVLFRRIFLILKDIFEDGKTALEKGDKELIKNLMSRDIEINKLTHFCLRTLSKENADKKAIYFTIIHACERAGDEYKNMLSMYLNNELKIDDKFLEIYNKLKQFFNYVYNFTFDCKLENALKIAKENETLRKDIQSVNDYFYFRNLLDNLLFIQELQLAEIKDI